MRSLRWISFCVLWSAGALAQDVTVVGTVDQALKYSTQSRGVLRATSTGVKHITLLKISLSDKAWKTMDSRVALSLKHESDLSKVPMRKVQLGMGDVPVLDQGRFGSCVTFADTAAVDAVLGKGDYISQLCQLQLGRYLENNGYTPSGWDGSLGGIVLHQMSTFGIISKDQQVAHGCGGLTQYPDHGSELGWGTEMSPVDYHALSESLDEHAVAWTSVLDMYQVFSDQTHLGKTLTQVKKALAAGDRLTFGVLLPLSNYGAAGAVGQYHVTNDTWVLTPEIIQDLRNNSDISGHEMVITGYDDDAVAMDADGHSHRGLLTLRNSWGENMGDKGNFYMSYDYFKMLVIEVQRIRSMTVA
jgi:hypothetical protein